MMYEMNKKRNNIKKWFEEYVMETFTCLDHFGHLNAHHLNKSDDYLKRRLMKKEVRQSSTFIGKEDVIKDFLVSEILRNQDELIDYLADSEDFEDWEVCGELPSHIEAKKYENSQKHNWEEGALPCKLFVICFKKDPKNHNHLICKSAYPF